jgi:DNA (cytosine-5)-methyltransferase 1
LEFFGTSENCGGFLNEFSVAELLAVTVEELEQLVLELRSMRWDVRTHRTHPTIRQDGLLCTYPFPLLSEKAQLERRLNDGRRA